MPSDVNYDDVCSFNWLTGLARMKISNKEKDIKKNDSSFELHDQWLAAVQSSYLINMFDNFHSMFPEKLRAVKTADDVVQYVLTMLEEFGIELYFNPESQSSTREGDDLFIYCQVFFIYVKY